MRRQLLLSSLVLVPAAVFSLRARADVLQGPVINPANQHAYYLLTPSTWPTAEAQAVALGGHLATINDAAENQWVFSTFGYPSGTDRALWIGLNDAAAEGAIVWADGTPFLGYANWYSGSPDNAAPVDYVYMLPQQAPNLTQGGKWTFLTSFVTQGVVEVVPEPTAAATLCLASAFLLRRRRGTSRGTH